MQKARGCAYVYITSTACKHLISVSISLPFRGSFHLSLTVLVHYRSSDSIEPYPMVGADSYGISRAPQYSGVQINSIWVFAYKAITFYGCPFQNNSTNTNIEA
jgi:hypothetical protein